MEKAYRKLYRSPSQTPWPDRLQEDVAVEFDAVTILVNLCRAGWRHALIQETRQLPNSGGYDLSTFRSVSRLRPSVPPLHLDNLKCVRVW